MHERKRGSAEGPFANARDASVAALQKPNDWPHKWRAVLCEDGWFIQLYSLHELLMASRFHQRAP